MRAPFLLFVEDDDNHRLFLARGCKLAGLKESHYKICNDGADAVAFLEELKSSPTAPRPSRVICDLKMPSLGGLGLLAWIRTDPHFKSTPVTLLSSSLVPSTILQAHAEGAEVIEKPDDPADLVEWVRRWVSGQ